MTVKKKLQTQISQRPFLFLRETNFTNLGETLAQLKITFCSHECLHVSWRHCFQFALCYNLATSELCVTSFK